MNNISDSETKPTLNEQLCELYAEWDNKLNQLVILYNSESASGQLNRKTNRETLNKEQIKSLLAEIDIVPLESAETEDSLRLDLLDSCHLLTSNLEQQGFCLGPSLLYLRQVLKFVLELLARGQFYPRILREAETARSAWCLLINQANDLERFSILAKHWPLRLTGGDLSELSPKADQANQLETFCQTVADTLIRLFLRRFDLLLPEITKQAQRPGALWFSSLFQENPLIDLPRTELLRFEERLQLWHSSLSKRSAEVALQLMLKINTPEIDNTEGNSWLLEFFLCSALNPERQLSAKQIWAGELGFLKDLELSQLEAEQHLLKCLGKALSSWPLLERCLEEPSPEGIRLNTEEVYQLLKFSAAQLNEQGIILQAPQWWHRAQDRLGISLHLSSEHLEPSRLSILAKDQLLSFSWQIAVGEQTISLEEFSKLVASRNPLIKINGEWIEIDPARVNATLDFIKAQKTQAALLEALQLSLGYSRGKDLLPLNNVTSDGWLTSFLQQENSNLALEIDTEGFQGDLRPYQKEGIAWLLLRVELGLGACLADDMGLGKTVQLLALILALKKRREQSTPAAGKAPLLVIVPMSILTNWEKEIKRFAPELSVYTHHGSFRESGDAFKLRAQNVDVLLTTYSLAGRDEQLLAPLDYSGIVLDEAQNIKNVETKQTKAIKRLTQSHLSANPRFIRLALSGTPMENRLDELWSIFDFLNPGLLDTLSHFRTEFAQPIERFADKEKTTALNRLIRPFVLRRLKRDPRVIKELPQKIEMTEFVPLGPEQAALYQAALDEMLPQVDGSIGMHRRGLILSTIVKLKQICDHPALFLKDQSGLPGRSLKIVRLLELLEEILAESDKVLLFTQFAQFGHILKPYLEETLKTEVLFLHGGLSRTARQDLVARFQSPEGPSIFLLSIKAGGFGLNLTQANQVIHIDQWWNPAVEEQATDRAYRIGQTRNVQVRKLICQGTLEERIYEMLKSKRELADSIISPSRDAISQLSTAELKKLLELYRSE